MTPDPESRPVPAEVPGEQEVDFGRYLRLLLRYWWLPALGLVLGLVIGLTTTIGTSRPYEAKAIVYLGQPYAPGGTSQILNLPTKFGFAGQLVLSETTIRRVASQVGVRPSRLRRGTSTRPVAGLTQGKVAQIAPLVEIKVTGLPRAKGLEAANALADLVARAFSTYVDQKLKTYQARRARAQSRLERVNAEIESARAQQEAIIADRSLPPTEKYLLLANLSASLQFNETRQSTLEGTLLTLGDLITLAEQVERARVVEPATVSRAEPPSRRSSMIVGAVIGLLLGAGVALVWEPLVARVRARQAA
ncbi:MAG: hypothetical protein C4305_07010, partial [Thermoleophilia bacterium]